MAKKKRRGRRPKPPVVSDVQQDVAFMERLKARVVLKAVTFLMILQILMEIFQNCPDPAPAKITRRIARARPRKQARMALRLQKKDPSLSDYEAAALIVGIVAEANENPEDFAAMIAEELADKDED